MKLVAFSLLALAETVFAGDRDAPKAPVGVYLEFEHPSSDAELSLLESEVGSILGPLGFDLRWRGMDAVGREVWVDLALVTFRGHCDLASVPPKFDSAAPTLGETHLVGGKIQPFAKIECDRIGALVKPRLVPVRGQDRERLFQRAIARVVAHELYHIFAGTAAHESTGLGKAVFTTSDLLSDRLQFDPAQAHALRQTSAGDALQLPRYGK